MELGLNFDDAFYEANKKETKPIPTSYNAKYCSMLWFEKAVPSEGGEEEMQQLKYSADYHYGQGNYSHAMEKYERAIKLLPEHNSSMHQDMTESLARCHLMLGNHEKAIAVANKLYSQAVIPSHRTRHLYLLQHIYSTCGRTEGNKNVLQKLLMLHPSNVHFWISLANCYSPDSQSTPLEQLSKLSLSDQTYYKQLTCLFRAQCLLKYTLKTTSSFVKKHHKTLLEKINSNIEELNPEKSLIDKLSEIVSLDLGYPTELQVSEDKLTMQQEQSEVIPTEHEGDFEFKWFSWIKNSSIQHSQEPSLSDFIK